MLAAGKRPEAVARELDRHRCSVSHLAGSDVGSAYLEDLSQRMTDAAIATAGLRVVQGFKV